MKRYQAALHSRFLNLFKASNYAYVTRKLRDIFFDTKCILEDSQTKFLNSVAFVCDSVFKFDSKQFLMTMQVTMMTSIKNLLVCTDPRSNRILLLLD